MPEKNSHWSDETVVYLLHAVPALLECLLVRENVFHICSYLVEIFGETPERGNECYILSIRCEF